MHLQVIRAAMCSSKAYGWHQLYKAWCRGRHQRHSWRCRQAAHLGPYERHLCTQPKFPAGLTHAKLGTGQHAAQHVRDVLVLHARAIVLHRRMQLVC